MKILKKDTVVVLTGSNKGRVSQVLKAYPQTSQLLVKGVNLKTHFVRPNPDKDIQGGLVRKEAPIPVSKVAIYNPETQKADRVCYREVDGRKVRFYAKTKRPIEGDSR